MLEKLNKFIIIILLIKNEMEKNIVNLDQFVEILIENKDIILFVGSAISKFAPTNLFDGKELNKILFKSLTYNNKLLEKFSETFDNIIDLDADFGRIPLERTISIINSYYEQNIHKNFFEYFNFFNEAKNNSIHNILIELMFKKKNKIILTPNFDCAFEKTNIKEIKIITSNNIDDFEKDEYKDFVKIIKLHGSFDQIETIILTLERETKGLYKRFQDLLNNLLYNKSICFIGYGASDIDILPILLKIKFNNIYWLLKPPTKSKVNSLENFEKTRLGGFLKNYSYVICYSDILDVFNKINFKLGNKYPEITNVLKTRGNFELINKINSDISLPYRCILISKIFLILLKFDKAKNVLIYSYKLAKKLVKKKNYEFNNFKKQYLYLMGNIYNQQGSLIKAYKYFKKYLKSTKNIKNKDYYNSRLTIINSLIMLRKLNYAFLKIQKLKEELQNDISLEYKEKVNIYRSLLLYKLKIEELKYSIDKIKYHNIKTFNESTLNKLEVKFKEDGNIDSLIDCQNYKLRFKYYKYINNKKELTNIISEFTDFINTYKIMGNVMTYINLLRDKSKILIKLNKYNEAIEIHNFIINNISKYYGNDYQTLMKSYSYLSFLYYKIHNIKECLKYLLNFMFILSHFIFCFELLCFYCRSLLKIFSDE